MKEVLLDTLLDAIKIIPFLFVTFLLMEYIEHGFTKKGKEKIKKQVTLVLSLVAY